MSPPETRRVVVSAVCLAIAAAAWAVWIVAPVLDAPGYDLSAIIVGAKLVADGNVADLYAHHAVFYNLADGESFMRAARELGFTGGAPTAFVHAPLVAWLAQPLTHMHFPTLVAVWAVLSALAFAGCLWLSLDVFAPEWKSLGALAALMIAMLPFEPLRYAMWLAQTTPFIVAMILGALALVRRDKLVLAGLLMAIPAFIKLTPLVFVLVWAWQRRWRALAGLVAGLAVLSLVSVATLGWSTNVTYWHRVAEIGNIALVAFNNHSLSAFLMRFELPHANLEEWTMYRPTAPIRAAVLVLAALLVAIPAWSLAKNRTSPLVDGFALLLTLLVPSISWTHYFFLLVPIALLAASHAASKRDRAIALAGSTVAMLSCMRPIAPMGSDFATHRGLVIVGPTIAALIMTAVLAFVAVRVRTLRG